jgi:hypothetical protein
MEIVLPKLEEKLTLHFDVWVSDKSDENGPKNYIATSKMALDDHLWANNLKFQISRWKVKTDWLEFDSEGEADGSPILL